MTVLWAPNIPFGWHSERLCPFYLFINFFGIATNNLVWVPTQRENELSINELTPLVAAVYLFKGQNNISLISKNYLVYIYLCDGCPANESPTQARFLSALATTPSTISKSVFRRFGASPFSVPARRQKWAELKFTHVRLAPNLSTKSETWEAVRRAFSTLSDSWQSIHRYTCMQKWLQNHGDDFLVVHSRISCLMHVGLILICHYYLILVEPISEESRIISSPNSNHSRRNYRGS